MDCGDFECDAARLASNCRAGWVLLEVSFFVVHGQTEQTPKRTGKRKMFRNGAVNSGCSNDVNDLQKKKTCAGKEIWLGRKIDLYVAAQVWVGTHIP